MELVHAKDGNSPLLTLRPLNRRKDDTSRARAVTPCRQKDSCGVLWELRAIRHQRDHRGSPWGGQRRTSASALVYSRCWLWMRHLSRRNKFWRGSVGHRQVRRPQTLTTRISGWMGKGGHPVRF